MNNLGIKGIISEESAERIMQSNHWTTNNHAHAPTYTRACVSTHTMQMRVPGGEATEQHTVLGLLADVSMETVMSDLQTCTQPSIWLRLANQITSTHTQMNCQIASSVHREFSAGLQVLVLLELAIRCCVYILISTHTYGCDLTTATCFHVHKYRCATAVRGWKVFDKGLI